MPEAGRTNTATTHGIVDCIREFGRKACYPFPTAEDSQTASTAGGAVATPSQTCETSEQPGGARYIVYDRSVVAVASGNQSMFDFVEVGGIRTRVWRAGEGADVLVLHGWGGRIESVHPIVSGLAGSVGVLAVDLPGFGETALPPEPWGVADYAAWTLELLATLRLER